MDAADFQFSELYRVLEAELASALGRPGTAAREVTLDLEMPANAMQSSNLSMSEDWYTALLVGEMIAPHCAKIAWEEIRDRGYLKALRFRFLPAAPAYQTFRPKMELVTR